MLRLDVPEMRAFTVIAGDCSYRTTDPQRHELEPPPCAISGPSDPVESARF
jgi:hypothetical protein